MELRLGVHPGQGSSLSSPTVPNCTVISVPDSEESLEYLVQSTEFSMGFHCTRVRCIRFAHFSLRKGSLRNLKRLTPSQCVLKHAAATQQVSMVLEFTFLDDIFETTPTIGFEFRRKQEVEKAKV